MFFEEVIVGRGATTAGLVIAYGHQATDVARIWALPQNATLAARGDPTGLASGDTLRIPIPWRMNRPRLRVEARGVGLEVSRTGRRGERLSWVQTVYRHNQPIGPNPSAWCVDACTPDDDLPFYFTDAEIAADPTLRGTFSDHPSRSPPSAIMGKTRWRAIVSIAVVTAKRVTVVDSTVWGFDMNPANIITTVGPRPASGSEVNGHLTLLSGGVGTSGATFASQGWTFRKAPP